VSAILGKLGVRIRREAARHRLPRQRRRQLHPRRHHPRRRRAAPLTPRPRDPATANAARPKAVPDDRTADTDDRVRTDRIDNTGLVTLRHQGQLYHIGIGRAHAGTRVLLLVQDLHIRVINADTGELIRELTLAPEKRYQATGKPSGWPKKTPRPLRRFTVSSMS
jgi:hypothetical protein